MMFSSLQEQSPSFSLVGFFIVGFLAILGLIFIVSVSILFNTYGIYQIFDGAIHGQIIKWKESLKGSLVGVLFFFVAGTLVGLATFVLTFPLRIISQFLPIFILPYLLVFYATQIFIFITYPLIALTKTDPIRGIWQSCCLVWKNFGRALCFFLLYLLISICATFVIAIVIIVPTMIWYYISGQYMLRHGFDPMIFANPWLIIGALLIVAFIIFVGFILFNFYYGLQVLLMYDLKMRSEGYGILPTENAQTGQV
jgi:hypothetical protein